MHRPLVVALTLGVLLTVLSAVADSPPVALASLLAAFGLGAMFPDRAALAGAAVMAPQVLAAVVVGFGESVGLALVAVAAGLVAVGFSALLGFGGGFIRHAYREARG
ncbi:MAG: hypothetical protein ACRDZ3_04645 [Acidimicrobiia bacterium]